MSKAVQNLRSAQQRAMASRPKVAGFPYLAETLRLAGVIRNRWSLPGCQALFYTREGPVMMQGTPLITGLADVPPFDREALIGALQTDQAGESTFPQFLLSTWKAGIVGYEVDFAGRTCTYYGANGEQYVESYPAVQI